MLSIVIPMYNQFDFTKACIDSIVRNTEDYEIILVDNGSDKREMCKLYNKYYSMDNLTVFSFDKNEGFPKAVNIGIEISSGEYVCLLNNDVVVTPNWWKIIKSHFDRVNFSGIVSPCTNECAGIQRISVNRYLNQNELDQVAIKFYEENKGKYEIVNAVIGFCMFIGRDVIDSIGLFDESFGLGNSEDIDFCLRANDIGYEILIARDCFVHHYGSKTHKAIMNSSDYFSLVRKNHNILLEKRGGIRYGQEILYRSWEPTIPC